MNLSVSLPFVGNLNPKDGHPLFLFLSHPNISFPLPLLTLVFQVVSVLPLFSFSLITLYLPFWTHRLRLPPLWLSFIRSKPHFHHNTYSGRPFSLQMPSFCRIKALVQNQFPLLSIVFFPSIHSGLFFPSPHCFLLWVIRKIDSAHFTRLEQGHSFSNCGQSDGI